MVEPHPKAKKIEFPAGILKGIAMESQNQNPLTTKPLHGADTKDAEKKRIRQRAEALVRRIGETCDELDRLAEENPELVGGVTRGAEEHKDAYVRLKARLQLADAAPRCRWVRQDGTSCESPQMKKHIYCFAHRQMMEARALALSLPAPEDANGIQIGIMRIQKALIEGTVSTKMAGLLLYSMQLALQNVGQTTFGQAKTQDLVRTTVDEEEALRQDLFTTEDAEDAKEDKQDQYQHQRRFTTEDTEKTEEGKSLPLIHGGMERPKPVEWRPTPDMYRTDTPEGREAYEACLRMTIEPRLDGQRRAVQTVIGPDDSAETHANLG
jgi:hypothetical protein